MPRTRLRSLSLFLTLLASLSPALAAQEAGPEAQFFQQRQAQAALDAGDLETAERLWRGLIEARPDDAQAWFGLARTLGAARNAAGAGEAIGRALDLGASGRARLAYAIAQLQAAAGQREAMYSWIERALEWRFTDRPRLATDDAFAAYRDEARFKRLAGVLAAPIDDRVTGWRADLDHLFEEARRLHASPLREAHSEAFAASIENLKTRIGELDDDRVLLEMATLLRVLNDGHSWVGGPGQGSPLQVANLTLPVRFYLFADGVHVTAAAPGYENLVGRRVLAINETGVDDLITALEDYVSRDNWMSIKSSGITRMLPRLVFLQAIGAVDGDRVALRVVEADGSERSVAIAPGTYRIPSGLRWTSEPTPRWLQRRDEPFWFEAMPEHDAVYARFWSVRDPDGTSLAALAEELHAELRRTDASRLIIDVRLNGGGDNTLLMPLLRTMVGFETSAPDHRVVVLLDRHTFSAAQSFVTRADRLTNVLFVGEPSGSRPNHSGESSTVILPYSRVRLSIANRYWQDSDPGDDRLWIYPDVLVEPTESDFREGRDPALDAALRLLERLDS